MWSVFQEAVIINIITKASICTFYTRVLGIFHCFELAYVRSRQSLVRIKKKN